MKYIAKQTLLLGAFAMLFSSIPMQARQEIVEEKIMVKQDAPATEADIMATAPVAVQEEVAVKQSFFAGWTKEAVETRIKNLQKELDKAWGPFMRCVTKGGEDCSRQAKVVRGIIISILAAITGGALYKGVEWIQDFR